MSGEFIVALVIFHEIINLSSCPKEKKLEANG
jgi:hypothetical protein